MKLVSRTRGTSAPPQSAAVTTVSLVSASLKLSYAVRRRPTQQQQQQQQQQVAQQLRQRLGSPFTPHRHRRGGTPSTTSSSIAEGGGALHEVVPTMPGRVYWLRSSGTSELEHRVRELRCTGDLRTLIDIGIVRQDASVLNRCHGLLFDSLNVFVRMCGET